MSTNEASNHKTSTGRRRSDGGRSSPEPPEPHPGADEELRLLADSARDFAMIFTDPVRNVVRWSRGAEHVFGWTEAEIVDKGTIDFIFTAEDRAQGVPEQEQETALRNGCAEDDRWHLKKDGSRFWASGVMVALYDLDTKGLRGFGKVLRDMTDKKRTEEALRESEARLAAIFARAAVGLSEVGPDGRFLRVNDALCRILGRTREEVLSIGVPDVTHPEDLPPSLEALSRVTRTGGAASLDKRYLRPDGALVWANSSVTLLRDTPEPTFLVVTADLTERKMAEEVVVTALEVVARANDELERRVEERTAALTAALTGLKTLAARVVSAQEEERRRISRELHDSTGQHLAGLSLGLKELGEGIDRPEAQALLKRLRGTADELGKDVHRIAVDLRPTALDDLGLIPALHNLAEKWSERMSIPVEFFALGNTGRPLLSPPAEIVVYRVVQEALNNAAKYAAARATRVSVTLQRFGCQIQAVVEDDGPGFDVEEAARSGRLGLSGMRERAELAGGTLEVESTVGEGTTVFLRVPINSVDE